MNDNKIDDLINSFSKFFVVSKNTSEKIITNFIEMDKSEFDHLINDFKRLKDKIKICKICSSYSDEELCSICNSNQREKKLLLLEDRKNITKIEELNNFYGKYFLLPLIYDKKGIKKFDYSFEFLNEYSKNFDEIIIGISNTEESQYTINEILKKLNHNNITKLATGIPFGVSIQYVDNISFESALKNRKEIK